MKNATQHAQTLKALIASLTKAHAKAIGAAGDRPALDPLRALVLACLREDQPEAKIAPALAALDAEFGDANEIRVATELELADHLEPHLGEQGSHAVAERLKAALGAVFEVEGHLSLSRIEKLAKREQRQAFRALVDRSEGNITPFAEGHVALTSFAIGTLPIDATLHALLVERGAVDAEADAADVRKFVEQNVKLDDAWPFFIAARAEAHAGKAKPGRKPPAKKVSKKTSKSK